MITTGPTRSEERKLNRLSCASTSRSVNRSYISKWMMRAVPSTPEENTNPAAIRPSGRAWTAPTTAPTAATSAIRMIVPVIQPGGPSVTGVFRGRPPMNHAG